MKWIYLLFAVGGLVAAYLIITLGLFILVQFVE